MNVAIDVRGLRKTFGALRALDDVDLAVEQGEFFALLGPNGAGKTTMISILAGLTRADGGEAKIMGHCVVRDYRAARRSLGVVPQELVFDPFFTVRETLRIQSGYFGLNRNEAWIDEIMERLDLAGKADANMRALSGGMKRRVLVAQALVHKPPVIILDEPTAGVDVELRQGLWQFVRKLNQDGHTVVLTTHYLEEAETLCSRVAMLKQGRIVALDTTRNLMSSVSALRLQLWLSEDRLPEALDARASRADDGSILIPLARQSDVADAIVAIRSAGVNVREMRILEPDLEDVFMRTMGRE